MAHSQALPFLLLLTAVFSVDWVQLDNFISFVFIIPMRVVSLTKVIPSHCFGKASSSSLLCLCSDDTEVL